MNTFSIHTLTSAFDFALHASLLGAVGVALVLAIRSTLGRRIAPAARGWLWLPVAVLCLSPRLPDVVGWSMSPEVLPATVREVMPPANTPVVVRGEPQLLMSEPVIVSQAARVGLSLKQKLAIAWGTGCVALFGFWLAVYMGLWKRIHRERSQVSQRLEEEFRECVRTSGLRRKPGLIVTSAVDNPAVAGLWKPVVLMPPGLSESLGQEPLRHVLLHELGHIRRGDLWLHWLSALVVALHWFNPFAWVASRKFRADREAACDAAVIGASGGRAHAYGETLLTLGSRVSHTFAPRLMAGILGSADLVKQRIVDIARMGQTSGLAAGIAFVLVMGGAAAIAVAAAEPGTPTASTPSVKPAQGASGEMYTRTFKVPPTFLEWAREQAQQAPVAGEKKPEAKLNTIQILKDLGVVFPEGASAIYVPSSSQLIARNTAANLDIIEVLVELNAKTPARQVYVTCQLVVFKEGSKPELLGTPVVVPRDLPDSAKPPATDGGGPLIVQHPAGPPPPFAVSGVFSDPQFQAIWRSLSGKPVAPGDDAAGRGIVPQFKGIASDVQAVIGMPSVTTRSGKKATLEVVREFIYPTEYDKTKPEKEGGPDRYTPTAFEMKPLGFRMEMEPVIGPDGYTIDLLLSPQLPGFTGWLETPLARGAKVKQPSFSSNTVNTSVTIWDGQTVAFGGEAYVAPFLMNPSLKGEAAVLARKHPVMIFVTARMIDPTGNPVRNDAPKGEKASAPEATPATTPSASTPKKADASNGSATSRAKIHFYVKKPDTGELDRSATAAFTEAQLAILLSKDLRMRAAKQVQKLHPDIKPVAVDLGIARLPEAGQVVIEASGTSEAYVRHLLNGLLDEMMVVRGEAFAKSPAGEAKAQLVAQVLRGEKEIQYLAKQHEDAISKGASREVVAKLKAELDHEKEEHRVWKQKLDQADAASAMAPGLIGILERPSSSD